MNEIREIRFDPKKKTLIGDIGKLEVDETAQLNDVLIDSTGGVKVGRYVHCGHQVMILTTSHPTGILSGQERMPVMNIAPIVIADNVYIGSRAMILKGVKIGESSYIGAGSVVTENTIIGERELWAGNPAVFKRKL